MDTETHKITIHDIATDEITEREMTDQDIGDLPQPLSAPGHDQ